MNKLLFKFEQQFGKNITLVSNNHKDLEDHLNENYDWYLIEVSEDSVLIQTRPGFEKDIVSLEWVKCV